ncbi:MAG: patatin-like phospholipase family protein, partial [Elusimicrobiota bacterium]
LDADNVRNGALQNEDEISKYIFVHASGLEILQIKINLFSEIINNKILSFIELLNNNFDFCVFTAPENISEPLQFIFNASDRLFLVADPQTSNEKLLRLTSLKINKENSKTIENIWLSSDYNTFSENFIPQFKLAWDKEFFKQFIAQGSLFFPHHAMLSHRSMDRLARHLGQLSIGFAMGSGAAFGYALIGMLKVMQREGIYPDVISGTSMGALIGSFYSAGIPPDQLEEIACSISRKKLIKMAITGPILPRTGLISGIGILHFLKEHLGDRTFSDLMLPFSCVATDIQTGKEIILNQGNVAEAVRASLSLPFFFQPYHLNGRYLVDGGLVNPVPTSIIVSQGANILISASLTSKASERKVPRMIGWWRRHLPNMMKGPSIAETMIKTIYIMQYEIASARSELAHVVFQIKSHDLLWWDLDQAKEMIRLGEVSAEEKLAQIKNLLPFYSDSCKTKLRAKPSKSY